AYLSFKDVVADPDGQGPSPTGDEEPAQADELGSPAALSWLYLRSYEARMKSGVSVSGRFDVVGGSKFDVV
ncbi:MAG: hypothetical protein ACRBN8_32225, partial [Nannocystales bacterium]